MKLWYNRTSKDPTYFIQQGFRNGKKTSTRNICRIGKYSELIARGIEDPLEYAKQQVAEYNEKAKSGKVTMEVNIDFDAKVLASDSLVSASTRSGIGYFFLQSIYHDLKIREFFQSVTKDRKITFDPNEVNRFLTYARILEPDSKLGTYDHLDRYYEKPSFGYQHVLRTMDLLYEHYDEYISWLYQQSNNVIKRNNSVCYFDCTNYYFETEENDDYVDEVTGEIIRGFRQYGPSKEHRPNPLVEMGLFMDSRGIPISMCVTSGSTNEQTLAVPLEKKIIEMFKDKEFIYCADGGLNSLTIRRFNDMGGRAFIVTQSVKKLSDVLQDAVFSDCGYRLLSNDSPVTIEMMKSFDRTTESNLALYQDRAYKILPADKAIDVGLTETKVCKNGKTRKVKSKAVLKQYIIVTFSRKMMEYQRHIRDKQVERAKGLLKNLDPETYKKGQNDVTRFIRRTSSTESGEKPTDKYEIDEEKIREEEKYDGFYAVATNLVRDGKESPAEYARGVLSVNDERYKIEDCFRIMKTNFGARPVFHQKKERITAHFMICYTALLVFRLLQAKLDDYGKTLKVGAKHFTAENIIETLQNLEVVNVQDMYYLSTYTGSQVLNALNGIINLNLDRKHYQPKELSRKLKKIL